MSENRILLLKFIRCHYSSLLVLLFHHRMENSHFHTLKMHKNCQFLRPAYIARGEVMFSLCLCVHRGKGEGYLRPGQTYPSPTLTSSPSWDWVPPPLPTRSLPTPSPAGTWVLSAPAPRQLGLWQDGCVARAVCLLRSLSCNIGVNFVFIFISQLLSFAFQGCKLHWLCSFLMKLLKGSYYEQLC